MDTDSQAQSVSVASASTSRLFMASPAVHLSRASVGMMTAESPVNTMPTTETDGSSPTIKSRMPSIVT